MWATRCGHSAASAEAAEPRLPLLLGLRRLGVADLLLGESLDVQGDRVEAESGTSSIPALMVIGSLVLPRTLCRSANLVLGLVCSAIILATLPGSAPFYSFLGLIEIAPTLTVSRHAWLWRRGATAR